MMPKRTTMHPLDVVDFNILKRESRLREKYQRLITHESETVKHLYQMFSPNTSNKMRATREIEPYDDLNSLREKNMGQRMADLRKKIYTQRKAQETAVVKPKVRKLVQQQPSIPTAPIMNIEEVEIFSE